MTQPAKSQKSSRPRRGRLRSLDVLQCLLPGFGAEGEDVAGGVRADAHEDVTQIVEGVNAVQSARGEQRVDDAGSLGSGLGSSEEPILASDRDAPELPLGGVVVKLEPGVVEESREGAPLVARVADGICDRTLRQDGKRLAIKPSFEGIEDRHGEPPSLIGSAPRG